MVIAITKSGYIKRLPVTTYREQRRGGIGVMGMDLKDEDYIEHLFVASTHDYILFFTTVGKVYRLKVHELPLGSRQSKGRAIVNLLPFRQDEDVRAVIATRNFEEAEVPRLRDEEGHRQEDGVRGVQHAAQGRRDHRDQAPRRRRARRRAPRERRRRHAAWSRAMGQAVRFHGSDGALDGPRPSGVAGHEASLGRRGDRGRHRGGRRRPARRHRAGLRQAHACRRLPGEGPRDDGREDGPARRSQRPACRCAHRPRRLSGHADLRRRDGDPDPGRRHSPAGARRRV